MRSLMVVLTLTSVAGLVVHAQDAPGTPAAGTSGDFELQLSLDKAEYLLGDDVQIEVTLTNNGEKMEIPALLLEERSLGFEITLEKEGGTFTYLYTVTAGDPHIATRLPLPRVSLDKGKFLKEVVRIPAVKSGTAKIKAVYNGLAETLKSAEVSVPVKPSEDLGNRLVAILDVEERGSIIIDLDPVLAPLGVTHFVALVRRGFYNDMKFHRVIKYNWVQTGCPYNLGIGGPGYSVVSEHAKQERQDFDVGTVAFSTYKKVGYIGSQFFICTGRVKALDGKYPVFGRVTDEGSLKVLKKIGKVSTETATDRPKNDLILKQVTINLSK